MEGFRYLEGVTSLVLEPERCIGCGECEAVCPHGVLVLDESGKASLADRDACMECGACATNCPTRAVQVNPGVGCASYIIQCWIKGKENAACGSVDCC
jgi:NAD-dependent dihydropyrimidine dehydrogenase PreA subunit